MWTGQELVRFGLSSTDETLTAGAAYDPATRDWRRLADAPLPARPYANKRPGSQSVAWTGDRMLVYAGHLGRAGSAPPAMLAYDPQADRWERLPSLAGAGARPELAWAGDRVLLRAGGALYELAV